MDREATLVLLLAQAFLCEFSSGEHSDCNETEYSRAHILCLILFGLLGGFVFHSER